MIKNIIIAILIVILGVIGYKVNTHPKLKAAFLNEKKTEEPAKADGQAVPSLEEATALLQKNMQNFALSLKAGSMACFYHNLSDFWKQKTTVKKLDAAFAPFIKARLDLTGLSSLKPVIEKGSGLLKNGDLLLTGHYNASNAILKFREVYRYEKLNGWGLTEFFVEIVPKQVKQAKK